MDAHVMAKCTHLSFSIASAQPTTCCPPLTLSLNAKMLIKPLLAWSKGRRSWSGPCTVRWIYLYAIQQVQCHCHDTRMTELLHLVPSLEWILSDLCGNKREMIFSIICIVGLKVIFQIFQFPSVVNEIGNFKMFYLVCNLASHILAKPYSIKNH